MTFPNHQIIFNAKTFSNDKKTFFEKLDKSKKGEIDAKIIPLLNLLNQKKEHYTTSSCSGRVYLWKGTGKKNETEWLKVSHDFINKDFFSISSLAAAEKGLVWLRLEPLIAHVACKDLDSANKLLAVVRKLYKKSCLLSLSSKIIVEIRGSEFLDMPLYQDGKLLFSAEIDLVQLVNKKLTLIFNGLQKLTASLENF